MGRVDKDDPCSLVRWEEVTQFKKNGGLGLRSTRDMNTVFLANLGWRMMEEENSLCANTLVNISIQGYT